MLHRLAVLHCAVVKRAYVELRERVDYLQRLAFWTIRAEEVAGASELFHLTGSKAEGIDVVMTLDQVDVEKQRQALDCYVTYRETIEAHQDGSRGQAQCPAPGGV